ncbi:hypothetical protein R3P38DRAFT_1821590 [Favolaschia claudopus]|uniref:Uncharacterized protein n=1 Tax=Favolaschia claudopus TaxID=2862362 RepID=A0AAW0A4E3_9AGAR
MTFAQFLTNAGITMSPAEFIGIIAGGVVFLILLIIIVVHVHRRNKRQMKNGALDKTAFSVMALAHPRPPLGPFQGSPQGSPDSFLIDREAQQHDLIGREVRQQEQTYLQLMMDLQRPISRNSTPPLPNQAPRELSHYAPNMAQRSILPVSVTNPTASAPSAQTPLPEATPPHIPDPAFLPNSQLSRGISMRSQDSTESEYSVASAARDPQERSYKPFTLSLATVPASPITPAWPASPGSYAWPKGQRSSQIRDELAPETYSKVRWKTNSQIMAAEPVAAIPVAQAVPSTPVGGAFGSRAAPLVSVPPPALRIHVPPPTHHRTISESDSSTSVSTAHLYYANNALSPSSSQKPRPF